MKRNRILTIYIVIGVVILLIGVFFVVFSRETVQRNVTEIEYNKQWNKVMADRINQQQINLIIDNHEIDLKGKRLYFTDNMQLMVPVTVLTEGLNCAENLYDKERLVIEKGSNRATLHLGSKALEFNENEYVLSEGVEKKDGEIYVPAELFTTYFNYELKWDSAKRETSFANQAKGDSFLPERYSYPEVGKKLKVKNQGNYGTCWAFATLSALESSLLPEETLDFSENNLIYNNALSNEIHDGGDYIRSMAYLMSWSGPVNEKDDPYGSTPTTGKKKVMKHVQGAEIIPSKDYQQIKEKIFKYGGVESSIYMSGSGNNISSQYYNRENASYCYQGEEKPNHDVVIVGWDDQYPKENFRLQGVQNDGAFICQNSWGENFGDQGIFYVSYEDSQIGTLNVCYTDVEQTDNYDAVYQYDLCGWLGTMGFEGNDSAYFSNVFYAKDNENLQAVGFYAAKENLNYEVFVCGRYDGKISLNDRTHVAADGILKNQGYYTIRLDKDYQVKKGEAFAVIVKVTNTDNDEYKLIPVEMESDGMDIQVDLSDGEGYISSTGEKWQSAEKQDANICLKAYTKKTKE